MDLRSNEEEEEALRLITTRLCVEGQKTVGKGTDGDEEGKGEERWAVG